MTKKMPQQAEEEDVHVAGEDPRDDSQNPVQPGLGIDLSVGRLGRRRVGRPRI